MSYFILDVESDGSIIGALLYFLKTNNLKLPK